VQCPFCERDSQVVDSRTTADGGVRRRRVCSQCKRRFTTYERVGSPNLKVLKRSDKTEPFSSDKLLRALRRVCRHRSNVADSCAKINE
jgi:transcriptional repressor NrdR